MPESVLTGASLYKGRKAARRFTALSPIMQKERTPDMMRDHRPRDDNGGYGSGEHLFPSRTEKLSPDAPMVLGSHPGE